MVADDAGRGGRRALAEVAGLTVLVLASAATGAPGRRSLDLVGALLLVTAAIAVAARRRRPAVTLGVATACLLAYQIPGYPGVAAALPVLVALHAAVTAGRRRAAWVAVVVILTVGFAGELVTAEGRTAPDVFQRWFLLIGWMVAACVAAELSRHRRIHLDHAEQRARDAERSREETARRRADEERLRIARELHDSLTHCISIINVQAGVAVHLARKHDQPVPEALVTIQRASQDAMRELRATLRVLRAGDGPGRVGLDHLDGLVRSVGEAGFPVDVTVTGQSRKLPTPVDRAAFRVIQEALTNVTRHAGPASVRVRLRFDEHELVIHVDDDGHGHAGAELVPGVGLTGMRERVTGLGGSLHAGPGPGRGFRVRAALPLETPS
ncbi:sensor histidine kinase [Micromonospora sp. WMMC241]|uniref:sensor histidine kinase n=1 Tax=Micromonospora sp. WMMC241 TaxID=3015159 RepID=UPI0022B719E7|nr:sensor histidine kinase [Micromonospora sp. WMMC241]MCZ7438750.1 sensor histidine kinase [Micromonospora sp. WMMC241]